MRLEPPRWWYGSRPSDRLTAALLAPAAWAYGAAADARFALATPYRSTLPVICVGNFTAGGAGKTPLALEIARIIGALGGEPAFLTRGFGGTVEGPHWVKSDADTAADVGDEALLLARAAPTVVARNRTQGARAIEASSAGAIVMDDGFQNPSLVKDLALVAVDVGAGIGNGRVLPAGPLRAPLASQMQRAGAVVLIGDDETAFSGLPKDVPVIRARIVPAEDAAWIRSSPILAYCGIGRPAKFFATLGELGAQITKAAPFPDHHAFTEDDARDLTGKAARLGATLVTTEKDWVRIDAARPALAKLKTESRTLPIKLAVAPESEAELSRLVAAALTPRHRIVT
jgi:tetraacyldisaccharide 4'-kinase